MTSAWDYAVEVWRRPGVEAVCLELQADAGQLPILLLWRLWTVAADRGVDESVVRAAIDLARDWDRDVLGPLRQIRGAVKAGAPMVAEVGSAEVGRQVLAAELAAERALIESLETRADEHAAPASQALPALISLAQLWRPPAPQSALERLAAAAGFAKP